MDDQTSGGGIGPWEALLAGALAAGFCVFMLQWGLAGVIHSRKVQTVPDLKGRSIANALDMLAPMNLGLRKNGTEFNSAVPISSVLRQEPAPGTVVREGKIVRVIVSQGGETVLVPAVVGLPLRNAEMLLRQGQLTLGEVSDAYSLKQPKGMVLSQEPKSEASVERNAMVSIAVSAGPPPAGVSLMPDFLRKDIAEAKEWAAGQGIAVAETKDASSLFPFGVILSQNPPPDTVLSEGQKVAFVISGRKGQAAAVVAEKTFRYELSQGGSESQVRIVVVDKYGEREVFNGLRKPGSKVEIPLQETGGARVRIFLNGILVEERDL